MLEQPKDDGYSQVKIPRMTDESPETANQQATGRPLKSIEKAWLAGLVEGEGSIILSKFNRKTRKPTRAGEFNVRLALYNGDVTLIERVQELYLRLGVNPYISGDKRGKHRVCYQIVLNRFGNVGVVLKVLIPYLVGEKLAKAKIALRFLEAKRQNDGGQCEKLLQQFKNSPGPESSETTSVPSFRVGCLHRRAAPKMPTLNEDDIVHTAVKAAGNGSV